MMDIEDSCFIYLFYLKKRKKKAPGEMKQAFQPILHTVITQRTANGYACFIQAVMENESDYPFHSGNKGS